MSPHPPPSLLFPLAPPGSFPCLSLPLPPLPPPYPPRLRPVLRPSLGLRRCWPGPPPPLPPQRFSLACPLGLLPAPLLLLAFGPAAAPSLPARLARVAALRRVAVRPFPRLGFPLVSPDSPRPMPPLLVSVPLPFAPSSRLSVLCPSSPSCLLPFSALLLASVASLSPFGDPLRCFLLLPSPCPSPSPSSACPCLLSPCFLCPGPLLLPPPSALAFSLPPSLLSRLPPRPRSLPSPPAFGPPLSLAFLFASRCVLPLSALLSPLPSSLVFLPPLVGPRPLCTLPPPGSPPRFLPPLFAVFSCASPAAAFPSLPVSRPLSRLFGPRPPPPSPAALSLLPRPCYPLGGSSPLLPSVALLPVSPPCRAFFRPLPFPSSSPPCFAFLPALVPTRPRSRLAFGVGAAWAALSPLPVVPFPLFALRSSVALPSRYLSFRSPFPFPPAPCPSPFPCFPPPPPSALPFPVFARLLGVCVRVLAVSLPCGSCFPFSPPLRPLPLLL